MRDNGEPLGRFFIDGKFPFRWDTTTIEISIEDIVLNL